MFNGFCCAMSSPIAFAGCRIRQYRAVTGPPRPDKIARDGPHGGPFSSSFPPSVRVADADHRCEDVVPRLRLHHDGVGEHAAVPADVPELLGELPTLVAEPEAGVMGDVQLAAGVGRQAVAAGVVVASP